MQFSLSRRIVIARTIIRTAAALLAAALLLPAGARASDYQYFRMYGGTTYRLPPPAPLPAPSLGYVVEGPSAVGIGEPYAAVSRVTGATGAVTFSLRSGSLPRGADLDPSTGTISGTTTLPGDYEALLVATDSTGAVGTATLSVSVVTGFAISGAPVLSATVGGGYSATFSGVGGRAPYVFSTTSDLPPGLTLDPTGALHGTPIATGNYPDLKISAKDAENTAAAFLPFTMTVSDPLRISWAPPAGTAGVAYHTEPAITGGRAPFLYSASGTLPAGLAFAPSTGILSGTPKTPGSSAVSIQVMDADGRSARTPPFLVQIGPGVPGQTVPAPLAIAGTPGNAQTGVDYLAHFGASGGAGGYVFSLVSGTLPDGLTLDADGTLAGTPTVTGTSDNLQVKVTDAASATALSGVFSIAVSDPPALLVAGNPSSAAMIDTAYSARFTAYNGSGAGYVFSLSGDPLPPGLTLSTQNAADGVISGYPTATGTWAGIKVKVVDSKGAAAETVPFSITVAPHPPMPMALRGTVPAYLDRDAAFATTFTATGGAGGYVFSLKSGLLPPGLALDASGTLAGTPTDYGAYSFAIQVKDSSGTSSAANFSTIVPQPLSINEPNLGFAAIGRAYSGSVRASGGKPPYSYSIGGQLPPGLAFGKTTGTISGSAIDGAGNSFPLTLGVADTAGKTATKTAALPVFDPLTASFTASHGMFRRYFSARPSVAGGDGSYSFTLSPASSGGDPAAGLAAFGLAFDPVSGTVSGLPIRSGTVPAFAIAVKDGVGATALARDGNGSPDLSIAIAPSDDPADTPDDPGTPPDPTPTGPLAIANAANLEAVATYAYTNQFAATGGTPPYAFSLASGSLPAWLTLNPSSGLLSGTPQAADVGATGQIAVKATDYYGRTAATAPFAVTVTPKPPVNSLMISGNPAAASSGASYLFDLGALASGGTPPYSYALISGDLPAGMALASDGIVSAGQITGVTSTAVVRVSDAASLSRQAGLTFKVNPATAAITVTGGTSIRAGRAIAGTLSTSLPSPAWTLSQSGASPSLGLTLAGTSFSGTAPQVGADAAVPLTARAVAGAVSITATSTLRIVPPLAAAGGASGTFAASIGIRASSPALAVTGVLGAPSSAKIALLRAGAPFNIWSLCPGLVFSTSNGVISGTPTGACEVADLSIEVVDPADASRIETAPFAVSVAQPLAFSGNPDEAVQQSPYDLDLAAFTSGGSRPYSYALSSGSLPEGMTLASDGLISASVVTGSTTLATLVVTDAAGRRQTAQMTFQVSDAYASAEFTSQPRLRAGTALAGTLFSTLPSPTWTFTQVPATPSLNLSGADATFHGAAPTVLANTDFTVTAIAKVGTVTRYGQPMTVTVMPKLAFASSPTGTLAGSQGNTFPNSDAPTLVGLQETPTYALLQSGSAYDLAATCPGLTFDPSTGRVSGIPTSACTTPTLTLRVADSYDNNTAVSPSFAIQIGQATASAALTSSAKLRTGDAVSGTLATSIAGASWSFAQTPAAPDLGLAASGATFSGTAPTVTALTNYSIVATAARNGVTKAATAIPLQVAGTLAVENGPPVYLSGTAGNPLSTPAATLKNAVGAASYVLLRDGNPFSNLSSICAGLSFSAINAVVSGTPTSACLLENMAVRATDAFDGRTATSSTFTIAVGAANASIALAASDVRSGAAILGNLNTTLASATWSYTITPNTPKLTLTTSGGAARGTAPSVSAPVEYTIVASAASGSVKTDTTPVTLKVWPQLVVTGPSGNQPTVVGKEFATPSPSTGTTAMGTVTYTLLKSGGYYANLGTDCPGLAFSETTGIISGTPTQTCNIQNLSVMATDVDNIQAVTTTFNVGVYYGIVASTLTSPSPVHSGQPFEITATVDAGTGLTAPTWSILQSAPATPVLAYDKIDGGRSTTFTGLAPTVTSDTGFSLYPEASDAGGSSVINVSNYLVVKPTPTVGATNGINAYDTMQLVTGNSGSWAPTPAATNVIGTLTWSLQKDGAPYTTLSTDCPGMAFSTSTGTISGSNVQACYVTGLRIAAADSADVVPAPILSAKVFAISVAPAIAFPSALPTAQQGQPYDVDLATLISGGRTPYTYQVISGSLPAGVTLQGNGHLTTGSDVVLGSTSTATIRIIDADYRTYNFSKTLTVTPATTSLAFAGGKTRYRHGDAISGTMATSIASPTWTMTQAPATPDLGLAVDGATFSGAAPDVATTTSYTVSALATSGSFSIRTANAVIQVYPDQTLAGGPVGTVVGTIGTALAATATMTPAYVMGTASYSLLQAGNPYTTLSSDCTGLTFTPSTGRISGTPTAACLVENLTVRVVDSADLMEATTTQPFSVSVAALPTFPSALPTAQQGQPYDVDLDTMVSSSRGPLTYAIASGSLPTGIALTNGHLTTGSAVVVGTTATHTIRVTDADGRQTTFSKPITVTLASASLTLDGGKTKYRNGETISGTVATSIAQPSWTMNQTPASPGIGLTENAGVVSGTTPMVASTTTFTLSAKATSGSFSITTPGTAIQVYPNTSLMGGPSTTLDGYANLPIPNQPALSPNVMMGTASYVLLRDDVSYENLSEDCPGLGFSPINGKITGTPTAACEIDNLTIQVSDSYDNMTAETSTPFSISISGDMMLGGEFSQAATSGTLALNYSSSMIIANGTGPYSVALESGSMPPGLTLDVSGSSATLTGIPTNTTAQQYTFTIRVTDSGNPAQTVVSTQQKIKSIRSSVTTYTVNTNITIQDYNTLTIECAGAGGEGVGTIKDNYSTGTRYYQFTQNANEPPPTRDGVAGYGGASYATASGVTLCEAPGGLSSAFLPNGGGSKTYPGGGLTGNTTKTIGNSGADGSSAAGGASLMDGFGRGGGILYQSPLYNLNGARSGGGGAYAKSVYNISTAPSYLSQGSSISLTTGKTTGSAYDWPPTGYVYNRGAPGTAGAIKITIQ